MTMISREEVVQLASLSSLQVSGDDIAEFQSDIETILEHVATLSELDTDGVEPTYQVNDLENVWRKDAIDQPLDGHDLVALAADHTENTITVPKVL